MGTIVRINGEKVSKEEEQLTRRYWMWANEAMTKKLEEKQIESLTEQHLIWLFALEQKAVELKISDFTKEEEKTIRAKAEYFWNQTVEHYKTLFLKEQKAFSQWEAFHKAESFLHENGYSVRQLIKNKKMEIIYDRMMRLYWKKATVDKEEISKEMQRRIKDGNVMNIELLEKVTSDLKLIQAKRMLKQDIEEWISESEIVREA